MVQYALLIGARHEHQKSPKNSLRYCRDLALECVLFVTVIDAERLTPAK